MRIIVTSTNPVKINAAREAFVVMFPNEECNVLGCESHSGVPDQPMGEEETRMGARNRVAHALRDHGSADFLIGIEGGIIDTGTGMHTLAIMHIRDAHGNVGEAQTATFSLPKEVCVLVRSGMELGHACDQVFHKHNSKQHNGSVGILTDDLITRTDYYVHALILALIPFKNAALFRHKTSL